MRCTFLFVLAFCGALASAPGDVQAQVGSLGMTREHMRRALRAPDAVGRYKQPALLGDLRAYDGLEQWTYDRGDKRQGYVFDAERCVLLFTDTFHPTLGEAVASLGAIVRYYQHGIRRFQRGRLVYYVLKRSDRLYELYAPGRKVRLSVTPAEGGRYRLTHTHAQLPPRARSR